MVEAKLVEQLLLKPEVRDLNTVNGKISIEQEWPIFKKKRGILLGI